MENKYCIVLTTTDQEHVADLIANTLVKEKLAGCVQIDQVKSIYAWENQVENGKEYRLMIKCISSNYDLIEKAIIRLHNYKLPQIVKIDITGGSVDYLKWLGC